MTLDKYYRFLSVFFLSFLSFTLETICSVDMSAGIKELQSTFLKH
jgi:hypothetical protein